MHMLIRMMRHGLSKQYPHMKRLIQASMLLLISQEPSLPSFSWYGTPIWSESFLYSKS